MAAIELYAFWRYDQYPYVLHAKVESMADDGSVCLAGYGGMSVQPLLLLPLDAGQELGRTIGDLKAGYHDAKLQLDREWRKNAGAVLPREFRPPQWRDNPAAEKPPVVLAESKLAQELPPTLTLREKAEKLAQFFRGEAKTAKQGDPGTLFWCAGHVEKLLKEEP